MPEPKKSQPRRKEKRLDPSNPKERRLLIQKAVKRTVDEYGEALKRLGQE